ncbi:MAG: hypothetical protein HZB79_09560 [Deltaproteobacteria bacterium]|nr:hypothetical protein [Deltaproteobacteria bacterium]
MPKINEATYTDPCLIPPIETFEGRLAEPAPYLIRGTSLKVIERGLHLAAGSGGILCLPVRSTQAGFISRSML